MPDELRRVLSWRPAWQRARATEASVARARHVLIACCIAAAAAVLGTVTLLLPGGDDLLPAPPAAMEFPTPAADPLTAPVPAAESTVPLSPGVPAPPGGPAPPVEAANSIGLPAGASLPTSVTTGAPPRSRPAPSTTATRRPPPPPGLTVGTTVGLEVRSRPGFRVRHRDFLARVDRISAASSAADRADANFAVRRGLARATCFSLESVNFPGRFLRHRDFVIHLDARDGTPLFAQDATFCPTGGTGPITLRSVNYPDRGIALRGDGSLQLAAGGVIAFVVRGAL
jgi:Alpha-L-arabinofuranosidase B (ABFB) domain